MSLINFINILYTQRKLMSTLCKIFLNFFKFYGIINNLTIFTEYLRKPVIAPRIHFILGNQ